MKLYMTMMKRYVLYMTNMNKRYMNLAVKIVKLKCCYI